MHITFIQTGGTIDKDYPRGETNHGYGFAIGEPAVNSILPFTHAMFSYEVVEVAKKDSLDLTDEDRKDIYEAVGSASSDKIIITHGTDTMLKTAQAFSAYNDKTIVITGSMLPQTFTNSDARFNVGMAVASVQNLPAGVYVALYGQVVPWSEFKALNEAYEEKMKDTVIHGSDKEHHTLFT